jgi:acetylornithine deacetylase/succinyl-diaminopimelate desuccinylase-like protein
VLLEGEEEAGGEFVGQYVPEHAEKLKADAAFICDTHMNSIEQPSLVNGLRGILFTEIAVSGPKSDLHSGGYGGVAPNPIHALCLLIARLKGEDGRVNIPGIYDIPVDVTAEEKSYWQENQDAMEKRLLNEMGVDKLVGENDIPPQERLGIRPTLEVHGIRGGFIGEGAKTVIPAEAVAKVSMRLPAGMKSDLIFTDFENAVHEKMPVGYKVKVTNLHGGEGVSISPDNSFIQAASAAIESIYGKKPVFMREGGSIPIAALFDDVLGVPVVLMGFGLPDDGAHGPNEKFSLAQFKKGMRTVADYLGRLRQ